MSKEVLDEREFELINIVGSRIPSNQRDLSDALAMSLGQTNMLIRRLISKGYIRITQLNKKKVQYLLTPKGLAEKMRKSVKYTLKTLNSISLIKDRIKLVLKQLCSEGERNFVVIGKSDFAFLIDLAVRELNVPECTIQHVDEFPSDERNAVFLVCKENIETNPNARKVINLIVELAKDEALFNAQFEQTR